MNSRSWPLLVTHVGFVLTGAITNSAGADPAGLAGAVVALD